MSFSGAPSGIEVDAHIDDLGEFVQASPSSYHAVAEVARRLDAAGFTQLDEAAAWPAADQSRGSRAYVLRDGAVVAWVVPPGARATTPFRVIGAHSDSPGFKLKPGPSREACGWLQAGVEVYGGPLLNSWLDRELELAGRLVTLDGREHLVRTGPFLRIPQLAIHLDREVNDGLKLDRQRHTVPVFGVTQDGPVDLLAHLADLAGVVAASIVGHDVLVADTAAPARFGAGRALFASGRLDNLSSVHAGLAALSDEALGEQGHVSVLAVFDHEEIGSQSRSGAAGPLLDEALGRIGAALGSSAAERAQAYARSWCVSSDAGHAVHPNYPERHDPANRPTAGGGPLLKINASQRYATDAHGTALWARACRTAGVTWQPFVSHNTVPCGSTIGPLTATRLGLRVLDVGTPLLSMHSARELAHVDDLAALTAALTAFLTGA